MIEQHVDLVGAIKEVVEAKFTLFEKEPANDVLECVMLCDYALAQLFQQEVSADWSNAMIKKLQEGLQTIQNAPVSASLCLGGYGSIDTIYAPLYVLTRIMEKLSNQNQKQQSAEAHAAALKLLPVLPSW